MSTAIAPKENTKLTETRKKLTGIRELLDRSKAQIAQALPSHMTPERMLRVTMTAIQKTPKLLDCDPTSVIGCVVAASQLGLETDGTLGHAYLVPFNNSKTGRPECQLIPGYRGLMDLARRSGQISTIYAHIVYEKDDFAHEYGLNPVLTHRPHAEGDPGPMVAAYAVARLRDGGVQFVWLWKREIDKVRSQSKAGTSGPWRDHYDEMAKKTCIRRLFKMLPVSVELQKAVALEDVHEVGKSQRMAAMLDLTDEGSTDALAQIIDDSEREEREASSRVSKSDLTPSQPAPPDALATELAARLAKLTDPVDVESYRQSFHAPDSDLTGEQLELVNERCEARKAEIRKAGRGERSNPQRGE